MFDKLEAVVLFVEDFETCLAFYEETLGLEVIAREPVFAAFRMNGHNFALQGLPQSAEMVGAEAADFPAQTEAIKRVMLCAEVGDVDAAYEKLKAGGVTFTSPPVNQPWGIRAAYFTDPEGNIWELLQPPKG